MSFSFFLDAFKYAKDPKTQGVRDEDVIYEKQETRQGQEAIYMGEAKEATRRFWGFGGKCGDEVQAKGRRL